MPIWRFFDYWTESDDCPIANWYALMDLEVQARFDSTVADLAVTEDWSDPELLSFDAFTRKPEHLGLAQVKFYIIRRDGKKRHYRAIGLWRQEQREFIFLTGFEKSGRATIPPRAFEDALDLRVALEERKGEIHDHV